MKQGVSLLSAFLEVCVIQQNATGRQLSKNVILVNWTAV